VDHKTVIVLCDIKGLSYEEIGKITGLDMGTVKSRISRARSELKAKLKGYL
jgi:RNA polymerase sigma-70 factor (ECF subfamily)